MGPCWTASTSYRRSGDERHRKEARRYAALLRLDSRRFPALYRRARPHLL